MNYEDKKEGWGAENEPLWNQLWFVEPTFIHNNFGLQMVGDPELIERLNNLAYREFNAQRLWDPRCAEKAAFGAFWQGQAPDWLYLEFWMEQTVGNRNKLVAVAQRIAAELGVPFFVCV